jgi:spermidine/putrescine transport system ATP-binding protein
VTHDQEEAMTMSDRLAVMRQGRVEQLGTPEDVYESPATEFVAGFLGASNLLDGEITERDGELAVVQLAGGSSIRVPADRLNGQPSSVKLGVRPEKITVATGAESPPGEWNSVTGTLRMATFIGVGHQYTVEGPEGKVLTVYSQNLGADPSIAPGDEIRLLWRAEHTFVVKASAPLAEWEEER